jgi:hypothetical protein
MLFGLFVECEVPLEASECGYTVGAEATSWPQVFIRLALLAWVN